MDMTGNFCFDESLYSTKPGAVGEFSKEDRTEIAVLRNSYPELLGWGDFGIHTAWGAFSQAVRMTGWENDLSRQEEFLNFLCWEQTRGEWPWGNGADGLAVVAPEWRPTR